MADEDLDPAASTQMFQAFVDRRELDEQEARTGRRSAGKTVAAAALVGLVIVLVLVLLVLAH